MIIMTNIVVVFLKASGIFLFAHFFIEAAYIYLIYASIQYQW